MEDCDGFIQYSIWLQRYSNYERGVKAAHKRLKCRDRPHIVAVALAVAAGAEA